MTPRVLLAVAIATTTALLASGCVSAARRAALPPEKPNESPELAAEQGFLDDYL